MRIEQNLPLSMILRGEPLANYFKSLECRCELASEARNKTGNELLFIGNYLLKTLLFIRNVKQIFGPVLG